MQNKKIIIIEIITATLLWTSVSTIALSILGHLSIWTGGVISSFLGIFYIATLSWYTCIDKMPPQINKFILIQILPLSLIGIFFDTITALIIGFTLVLGMQILFRAIKDIKYSANDHIKFRVKTIILPHTKGIIVWLMLLTSVFIYGNTLKTNPNGIFLEESFLSNQIQAWMPILEQIAPDFKLNTSVGNYISEQLDSQDLNLKNINRDQIIQQQIDELSKRFELNLTPDTPITKALVDYGNRFLTPWMSGPIWGAVVSLLVFLTFLPFVGIFQFGIKIIINIIHKISVKSKFINFTKQNIEKDTLSW
jgi:hypothetical protein